MKILHSTVDWLFLTKSWIYDQVRFMPENADQTIWTERLIDGPHNSWNGKVICAPSTRLERITNRLIYHNREGVNWKKYDSIISHFGHRAWQDYSSIRNHNLKKVVRFYGCDIGIRPNLPGWKDRYRKIFDEYDLYFAEGPYMAQKIVEIGGNPNKVEWVRLGIDPANVSKNIKPTEALIEPLKILIAASFVEKKGIEYALEGIVNYIRRSKHPVDLTLVGELPAYSDRVDIRDKILSLVAEISSAPNSKVEYMGYQTLEVLHRLMDDHLLFISPSIKATDGDIEGGFPVTLTHAAARGMILLGTDHCDLPLIIKNGKNGWVVEQHNAYAISEVISNLANMHENDIHTMRVESVRVASTEFSAVNSGKIMYKHLSE